MVPFGARLDFFEVSRNLFAPSMLGRCNLRYKKQIFVLTYYFKSAIDQILILLSKFLTNYGESYKTALSCFFRVHLIGPPSCLSCMRVCGCRLTAGGCRLKFFRLVSGGWAFSANDLRLVSGGWRFSANGFRFRLTAEGCRLTFKASG